MKTALIVPIWLGRQDYVDKTHKFLTYYTQQQLMEDLGITAKDIWLIDNNSDEAHMKSIVDQYGVSWKRYEKFYARTAHLEYPFCWRCLYFARDLFQEYDYQKVIHTNNDFFVLSGRMAEFIKDMDTGWWSPWCPKHNFPECDFQVIVSDSEEYWQMTGKPYLFYNGKHMEYEIQAAYDSNFVGDRHSEYAKGHEQQPSWDFSAQVRMHMPMVYNP